MKYKVQLIFFLFVSCHGFNTPLVICVGGNRIGGLHESEIKCFQMTAFCHWRKKGEKTWRNTLSADWILEREKRRTHPASCCQGESSACKGFNPVLCKLQDELTKHCPLGRRLRNGYWREVKVRNWGSSGGYSRTDSRIVFLMNRSVKHRSWRNTALQSLLFSLEYTPSSAHEYCIMITVRECFWTRFVKLEKYKIYIAVLALGIYSMYTVLIPKYRTNRLLWGTNETSRTDVVWLKKDIVNAQCD